MSAAAGALRRTSLAVREAARDASRGWTPVRWSVVGVVLAAAAVPGLLSDPVRVASLANWLYLVLAAIALAVPVGLGGMPVLSQGAFMAVGAFTAAVLRVRAGWSLEAALPAAVLASAAAGAVAGIGAVRLRTAFVAVSTWLLTWLVTLGLLAFPGLSGGADGLVLPPGRIAGVDLTSNVHHELALVLAVLAGLCFEALRHSPFGLGLAAFGEQSSAALALGVPSSRRRLQAFVLSAATAGLAGALAADLAGIADATAYGPLLSFQLLAVVLLGGGMRAFGPAVGVAVLALLSSAAGSVAALERLPAERFDAVIVAALVLAALSLGGTGLVPTVERLLPSRSPARGRAARTPPGQVVQRSLVAYGLGRRFGDLVALRDFEIRLEPGTVAALIGPNGSGKTTALRLLAGTDRGGRATILLGEADVAEEGVSERVRAGIVRTLQVTSVFEDLTALENVLVGAAARRRYGGLVRSAIATPLARTESARARVDALATLDELGLADVWDRPASELSVLDRRVLMLAAAVATRPSVLLVDELSAGAGHGELPRLAGAIESLRARGHAILLVEHNLRLVRAVATRVTVLDAGVTIATGTPDEIAADPAARAAYLARHRL
jgi:ABC-type branched-subunit amino acid transport system ATPase component/ABC-type branched-subunit amino acid transport system permease subunit